MDSRKSLSELPRRLTEIFHTFCLALMATSIGAQPLAATDINAPNPNIPALIDQKKWQEPLAPEEEIIHLLNRITFGARPGDVERVRKMGLNAFLEEQLHPESIDDAAVEARVAALPTLSMTPEELIENYPRPKQAANFQKRQPGQPAPQSPGRKLPGAMAQKKQPQGQMMAEIQGPRRVIMELAQEEVLRAIYSNRQLNEIMVQFWMNHFNIFAPKGADLWLTTSFERDTIRPRAMGKFEDLLVATAESPAMLFYLDNWLSATPNPTYAGNPRRRLGKPAPPLARNQYGVWRPFGRFGGLGRMSRGPFGQGPFGFPRAQRPGPRTQVPGQGGLPKNPQIRRGLNENYAREVMELHTLGVEGGYTQKDVTEVARCLTGWTIDRPQKGGGFIFRPQMHDFGAKVVLGHKIPAGHGIEDGLEVMHLLAQSPATAHFIALKLCRRFVSDDPPPALIARASKTFLKTDGDIRQVLKTILTSPEFYSQAAYRAKVKSPLELVVSAVRGLGGQTDASVPLLQMIARMGQPMFQYLAPTGFPDRASTWINSGTLLTRINFATLFAANRIRGTQIDLNGLTGELADGSPTGLVQELSTQLVGGELGPQTREAIMASLTQAAGPAVAYAQPLREVSAAAGLVLASPEFQRR